MKTITSLLFLTFSLNGNAQILNKIKQKAESKVNDVLTSKSKNSKLDNITDSGSSQSNQSKNTSMDYPFIVLKDAKFYFSDKPFTNSNSGAKNNFTSQDFIYGRLELGKTISETFKLEAQPTKGFHYLYYGVAIIPEGGSDKVQYVINNRSNSFLINEGEEKNTWLNFDVLSEPAKVASVISAYPEPEKISEFNIPGGMDFNTTENNIQQNFPANGTYKVKIILWAPAYDGYGKRSFENEKNIVSLGEFTYQFTTKDAATLSANTVKRYKGMEMREKMKTKLTKLPDWWNKPFTPSDAFLKPAVLTPMIKSYISKWNFTYIDHRVKSYSGNAGWTMFKDNGGFFVSRRANPEIQVLYKDPADGTCHIGVYSVDEDYAGNGTWGSPYMRGYWADEFIDCSAIK